MTLEEAIKHCEEVIEGIDDEVENAEIAGVPVNYAECEKCIAEHRQLAEWLKELKERREKDVSDTNVGDMVSRRKAIDALMEILDRPNHAEFLYTDEICKVLNELPSAQPNLQPNLQLTCNQLATDTISRQAAIDARYDR